MPLSVQKVTGCDGQNTLPVTLGSLIKYRLETVCDRSDGIFIYTRVRKKQKIKNMTYSIVLNNMSYLINKIKRAYARKKHQKSVTSVTFRFKYLLYK